MRGREIGEREQEEKRAKTTRNLSEIEPLRSE